jgi:hypothetical protein
MPTDGRSHRAPPDRVNRREFLKRTGLAGAGLTALAVGATRTRVSAAPAPYP